MVNKLVGKLEDILKSRATELLRKEDDHAAGPYSLTCDQFSAHTCPHVPNPIFLSNNFHSYGDHDK